VAESRLDLKPPDCAVALDISLAGLMAGHGTARVQGEREVPLPWPVPYDWDDVPQEVQQRATADTEAARTWAQHPDCQSVLTMNWTSEIFDVVGNRCLKVPVIGWFDLANVVGDGPIHQLVLYVQRGDQKENIHTWQIHTSS